MWVKNIREFKDYILKNGLPEFISFDHDLTVDKNNPEPDGREVAKWLVAYCRETNQNVPKCFVHSANQSKTPEMNNILGLCENKEKRIIKESQLREIISETIKKALGV